MYWIKISLFYLFSFLLLLVTGMIQLLSTFSRSLVERLRCPHQEEVHNVPEENVAPQVNYYSKLTPFLTL